MEYILLKTSASPTEIVELLEDHIDVAALAVRPEGLYRAKDEQLIRLVAKEEDVKRINDI